MVIRENLKPGDRFLHFEVVRELGSGVHGTVFEIRHRTTGAAFALKTMHAADCVDRRKVERALAAAKSNWRVQAANVVEVLDLAMEDDGFVWMRTELLDGYTLHDLAARQGRLSLPFVLAVGIEAAHGLQAIHEAAMVHRDIKPSNLFYTSAGAVKVLDFSLVKFFGEEGIQTTAARRAGLGTPAYAAPEQLEGVVPDARCDVYALGVTLWELFAGKHPYEDVLRDKTELLKRQLTKLPPLLSEVAKLPPRIDDVLMGALAKDPTHRYCSAMAFARALAEVSTWVATEARARRIVVLIPSGEPAVPGDRNTWREYRESAPTPSHLPPPDEPSERVIIAGGSSLPPEQAPVATAPVVAAPSEAWKAVPSAELKATLPLAPPGGEATQAGTLGAGLPNTVPPSGEPTIAANASPKTVGGGTALLPAARVGSTGTAPPSPASASPKPIGGGTALLPAAQAAAEEARQTPPRSRDTPAPITRSDSGARWHRPPARTPWIAVIAAVAVASLAGVFVVIWLVGHHTLSEVAPAGPAPVVTVAPIPAAAPSPITMAPGTAPPPTTVPSAAVRPGTKAPSASPGTSKAKPAAPPADPSTPPASAQPAPPKSAEPKKPLRFEVQD